MPRRGASRGPPRTTGEVSEPPAISKLQRETPRSITVPSASENCALRVGRSRRRFHADSGNTLYTAPESTTKRTCTPRPWLSGRLTVLAMNVIPTSRIVRSGELRRCMGARYACAGALARPSLG